MVEITKRLFDAPIFFLVYLLRNFFELRSSFDLYLRSLRFLLFGLPKFRASAGESFLEAHIADVNADTIIASMQSAASMTMNVPFTENSNSGKPALWKELNAPRQMNTAVSIPRGTAVRQ